MKNLLNICPVCGGQDFENSIVLSKELINDWKLSNYEVDYINLQQGYHCKQCNCNLRTITLASQILEHYKSSEIFTDFICRFEQNILEINKAGDLWPFLKNGKKHILKEYPEIDIENISFEDNSFDMIVHSDTLEHIPNPIRALSECHRVLKKGGVMFFTIPIIHERLTLKRTGMPKSYHGYYPDQCEDFVVHTEYGADFYKELFASGFKNISLFSISNLASISIKAIK